MTDLALQLITFIGVVIIIVLAEVHINETTFKARPRFVIAFVLLAGACLWQAMQILTGAVPDPATACAASGLALLLVEERRCPRSCALKREQAQSTIHGPISRWLGAPGAQRK